jgi:hypothetical protein
MNRWLRYALVVLLFLAVLVVGFMINRFVAQRRQRSTIYDVAGQLGYRPEAELAQTQRCWDIYAHCGVFLYYTVELSRERFEQEVAQLDLDLIRSASTDGYTIFTEINLGTSRRLTANGNDGLENREALPEPEAYEWHLLDDRSRRWIVRYYDVVGTDVRYALDGQTVHANIVSVLLQTR